MIGTSLVVQEELPEQYTLSDPPFFKKKVEAGLALADIEVHVTDMESGKALPGAMISIDNIGRTAVCDEQGRVVVKDVSSGLLMVDVIVRGYIANSNMVYSSSGQFNTLHIKMVRNC
jgi:hypothetical protein